MSRLTFVDDYLKRLQYSGPVSPNLETLKALHHRHMLTIPFENLNNVLKEEYPKTKEGLYEKIILGSRGGLCFELNSLFAFLLQDLGFNLIMVEGKVFSSAENHWIPLPIHQLLIVSLGEDKWVVDVACGENFTLPLRLIEDELQDDETGVYIIRKDVDEACQEWFIIESPSKNVLCLHLQDAADKSEDDEWEKRYKFNLTPRTIDHFDEMRNMLLNDPNSPLNLGLLCTQLRPWGRITVSRYKLVKKYVKDKKITGKEVQILQNKEEVMLTLEREFGVKLQHGKAFSM